MLKGHSQLRDSTDMDTTFASLKSVYLNPKSNGIFDWSMSATKYIMIKTE